MNNEELVANYLKKFDIIINNDIFNIHDYIAHTEDIIEKSCFIIQWFFNLDSLIYSSPCLFYRNGHWYKYSIYNPGPVQFNNANFLNDNQFFKLIKRNLLLHQKRIIINKFLKNDYELNLQNLNVQKQHLNIFKYLTIDSPIYNNIKAILEHTLEIDDNDII